MNEYVFWLKEPMNQSLAVGDTVYWTVQWGPEIGGFDVNDPSAPIITIGEVISIEGVDSLGDGSIDYHKITCTYGGGPLPTQYDYMFFSKPKVVEEAGIMGYYAEITMSNNSKQPAELFMTGVEVTQSS